MANFKVRIHELMNCALSLNKYSARIRHFDGTVNDVMNELKLPREAGREIKKRLQNISESLQEQSYQNRCMGQSAEQCAGCYCYTERRISDNQVQEKRIVSKYQVR